MYNRELRSHQITIAELSDEMLQARTNKKEFLEKMDGLIPWDEWLRIIEPVFYKGEIGNKPYPLILMLRIFILQNLYDLADMKVMYEIIDSRAFSEFCDVNSPNQVPDGATRCCIANAKSAARTLHNRALAQIQ